MTNSRTVPESDDRRGAPAGSAKTIAVVEDSRSTRELICGTLRSAGHECIEAENGSDALVKLAGRRIDLVISDVNMPSMDGISFVKQFKASAKHRFTPVIMLTSETAETKRLKALLAGATVWMAKPFSADKMLAAVSRLIQT